MSDTILTESQLKSFFVTLTLNILGLDPTVTANQDRVRQNWPAQGAPAWGISDDIAFISITTEDDPYTRQIDTSYTEADLTTANQFRNYTRVLRVNWVCYGPNSFDDADVIYRGLSTQSSSETLEASNLSLIMDAPTPQRLPELYNGQWWDRSSFFARFNELVIRQDTVPYIQTGDVQIIQG